MAKGKQPRRRVAFKSVQGRSSTARMDALVLDLLGRVANKRTMCVLEVLEQNGVLRFTRVEYSLTELGTSLCAAFCGVWQWAEKHEPELRALRKKRL